MRTQRRWECIVSCEYVAHKGDVTDGFVSSSEITEQYARTMPIDTAEFEEVLEELLIVAHAWRVEMGGNKPSTFNDQIEGNREHRELFVIQAQLAAPAWKLCEKLVHGRLHILLTA